MDPAVKTSWRGIGYCLIVSFFLVLPLGLGWTGAWSQRDAFDEMPNINFSSSYVYTREQIYDRTTPVDIAFVGGSLIWTGLNARMLQDELARILKRKITVISLAHPFAGNDLDYLTVRELLRHRSVKYIVMDTTPAFTSEDHMHGVIYRLFNPIGNREFFEDIPFVRKIALYGAAVLGSPRHLLSLLRPNVHTPSKFEDDFGSAAMELGFDQEASSFHPFKIAPKILSADEMIYNEKEPGMYEFYGPQIGPYSTHFLKLIGDVSKKHDVGLIIMHMTLYDETANIPQNHFVVEREFWPEVFGAHVDMIGIPAAKLFEGIDAETIKKLYYGNHFNKNGSEFFTKTVAPAFAAIMKNNDD